MGATAENRSLTEILGKHIYMTLTKWVVEQGMSDVDLAVESSAYALRVRVHCPEDPFLLLRVAVTALHGTQHTAQAFEAARAAALRDTAWVTGARPLLDRALAYVRQALHRAPEEATPEALQEATHDAFRAFTQDLLPTCFVETLYLGRAPAPVAFAASQRALRTLHATAAKFPPPVRVERVRWPPARLVYTIPKAQEPQGPNRAVVVYYFQVCDASEYAKAVQLGLYAQMTRAFVVQSLLGTRTQGTHREVRVRVGVLKYLRTEGYYIGIESTHEHAEALRLAIEACLERVADHLQTMTSEAALTHYLAYWGELRAKKAQTTLPELGEFFSRTIAAETVPFSTESALERHLFKTQLQSVREFFFRYIHPSSQHVRRLVVYTASNREEALDDSILIKDLHQWVSKQKPFNVYSNAK